MPAADTSAADFVVDEATNALRFTRDLEALPAQAFEAWTEPAQVAVWWDATGEKLGECDIDLRPGGAFRFVTRHSPDRPFSGVYREISPPSRLVFDANGAIGTVALEANGDGTRMTVEIVCSSAEHLKQFVAMGVAAGTSQTMDNLARHLRQS